MSEQPINWSMRDKCSRMDNEELESLIQAAQAVLKSRKNERANKLIEKVCPMLNELNSMGVKFIVHDYDGYDYNIFDSEDKIITKENFVIKEE